MINPTGIPRKRLSVARFTDSQDKTRRVIHSQILLEPGEEAEWAESVYAELRRVFNRKPNEARRAGKEAAR